MLLKGLKKLNNYKMKREKKESPLQWELNLRPIDPQSWSLPLSYQDLINNPQYFALFEFDMASKM